MSNLIGSQLNQVPTNSDLGDLAFQNATSLKQITANAVTGKDIYLQSSGTGSTPTLNLNFYSMDLVRNNYIDSLFTFQRNTTATVWKYDANNNPVLATVGVDVPRYEIDPVTGDIKGLLIEEQRTNLFTRSAEFDNAVWTKLGSTVTNAGATVAPDGTLTADYMTATATDGYVYLLNGVPSTATHTISVYAKAGNQTKFGLYAAGSTPTSSGFTLSGSGSVTSGTGTITYVGNGWYRCSHTFTTSASANVGINRADFSVADTVYIWGAQLEAGASATSYIPTTTAAVTRNADFISFPTSSFYSSSGGTLVLDATTGPSVVSRTFVALNNAGANEQIGIRCTTGGGFQMFNDTSAVTSGDPGTGTKGALPTIPVNTRFKAAFVFGTNDFRGSVNGTSVRSDTSGALATGITTMNIGSRNNSTSENCSAYIGSIQYYTGRFSDAILQELSA